MEILVRPQPVGIFPLPAGLLLLPPTSEPHRDALKSLLCADRLTALPVEWDFFSSALQDKPMLSSEIMGDSVLDHYNRFVLSGDAEAYRQLLTDVEGPLSALVEVAAFYHGLTDTLPVLDSLDGELRAIALMMSGSQLLEDSRLGEAMVSLTEAAELVRTESPVFAAQLIGQIAQLMTGQRRAIALCRDAVNLLTGCADDRLCAEAWIHLGQICQEQAGNDRTLLVEAAQAYQQALRYGIALERHSDLYALAQSNSGLAYLAMPMSGEGDKLRAGVAIQSFREALKVYDREKTPELWVSTQLNLANALQYMHSAHPEENLGRAVEIYEELLSMRSRAIDPVGYARVLANQANALAHLGLFAPAMTKATEAHKLLHWHNEPQLAATMLELTNDINGRLGTGQRAGTVVG